jgi:thymidylate synthase ThyX
MSSKKSQTIDEMREVMGTAPSARPKKQTRIINGCTELEVDIIDHSRNPFKSIVAAACATWGDDDYKPKWEQLSPENRYKVVLASVTGNTLPQALESVQFTFRVKGLPRHTFDQHARARIGTTFFSVGSRDNNKLDASVILYPKLYERVMKDPHLKNFFYEMKDVYEKLLENKGSWQIARAVLPMCYHHPYYFSQNYLALQGQCSRRMMFCEEFGIVGLHWKIQHKIMKEISPLLAEYLRPACDKAKKCVYAKSYGLSNAFGCLFAGCGRWPAGTKYATFNESCTDVEKLEEQLGFHIIRSDEWLDYNYVPYDDLDPKDKKLFEEE